MFELQEGMTFSKQIFAMVMMPLQNNRKKQLKFVEQFYDILLRYDDDKDRKVLAPYYIAFDDTDRSQLHIRENIHPKWLDKKLTEVLKILKRLYFFKRFSLPRIREFLNTIHLDVIKKRKILFFEKNKVYVIISGSILMKNHEAKTELPDTLAKFG